MTKISIVVSTYNEEDVIKLFYKELNDVLQNQIYDREIIFVDDGSTDNTLSSLRQMASNNKDVRVISFSRNFGHEAAMLAGIDHSTGDLIICMDADLQHPPEKILEMIAICDDGYDVISMIRSSNKDANVFGRMSSSLFYKLLNRLSPQNFEPSASDFFAISKRVADVLRKDYREKARFLRGYVQTVGFNKTTLTYEAGARKGGQSKYSVSKLFRTSLAAICGFSDMPLRMGMFSGFLMAVMGIILLIYSIFVKLSTGAPSGYTTIIVVLCFMFAILFLMIGMIGEYISIILTEVKNRPIYNKRNHRLNVG